MKIQNSIRESQRTYHVQHQLKTSHSVPILIFNMFINLKLHYHSNWFNALF